MNGKIRFSKKIFLLTIGLIGFFIFSVLYFKQGFKYINSVIVVAKETKTLSKARVKGQQTYDEQIKLLEVVIHELNEIEYWYASLALTSQLQAEKKVNLGFEKLEKNLESFELINPKLNKKLKESVTYYKEMMVIAIEDYESDNRIRGNSQFMGARRIIEEVRDDLNKYGEQMHLQLALSLKKSKESISKLERINRDLVSKTEHLETITYAMLFTFLSMSLIILYHFSKSIIKPFGEIIATFDNTCEENIKNSTQLTNETKTVVAKVEDQSSSLKNANKIIDEISHITNQNNTNLKIATEIATENLQIAETSVEDMKSMIVVMDALKECSDSVFNVVKSINEIAFRTNILSLNAAVEAAHAGDAGSGFTVVANEVRSLAQKCSAAAKDTTEKIKKCIKNSKTGVEISKKVAINLGNIVDNIRKVNELSSLITIASHNQNQGIRNLNLTVDQMEKYIEIYKGSLLENLSSSETLTQKVEISREVLDKIIHQVGYQYEAKDTSEITRASENFLKQTEPKVLKKT